MRDGGEEGIERNKNGETEGERDRQRDERTKRDKWGTKLMRDVHRYRWRNRKKGDTEKEGMEGIKKS